MSETAFVGIEMEQMNAIINKELETKEEALRDIEVNKNSLFNKISEVR